MCKLVKLELGDREIKVAEMKIKSIENIVNSVGLCNKIDKIVLFGSALEERCTEKSDVDIAVFGEYSKSRMFRLKSYHDFIKAIVTYGEGQDYDILYFDSAKLNDDRIFHAINNGAVLFERA